MAIRKFKCTDKVGDFVRGIPKPKDGIVEFDEDLVADDLRLGYLDPIDEAKTANPVKK